MIMTYEDYLNEVTTLIFEENDVTEEQAVKLVMLAQDDEFFVEHDDNDAMRVQAQADKDAVTIFKLYWKRKK